MYCQVAPPAPFIIVFNIFFLSKCPHEVLFCFDNPRIPPCPSDPKPPLFLSLVFKPKLTNTPHKILLRSLDSGEEQDQAKEGFISLPSLQVLEDLEQNLASI
ncbi:hypothetical protein L6452_37524 [Arctium lappa]|uniref:Uncharacterized protein n=1 Tax=Arctium lappa TaxID=4217 RepID=A0ACB8Y7D3_ARCLA|nr:hypothetical protein L6452_37524 [Arctium lappa]